MNEERIGMYRQIAIERAVDDPSAQREHIERLREALSDVLDAYEAIEAPLGGELGRACLSAVEGLVVQKLNGRAQLSTRVGVENVVVTYMPGIGVAENPASRGTIVVDVRLKARGL